MSIFDEIDADLVAERAKAAQTAQEASLDAKTAKQTKPRGKASSSKRKRGGGSTETKSEQKGMDTEPDTGAQQKTPKPRKAKTDGAEPGYYPLRIRNYVGNFYVNIPLNLWTICTVMRGRCSYPVFTSGTVKGRLPSIAFEVFENGKVGITGASSPCHAVTATWQFCARVSKLLRRKIHPLDFRIHNVVGSVGLGYALNLDLFFDDYRSTSTYNPDKFPGLHYHMESPRLVFLLYKSGKMVITQGKETTDLLEGFKIIDWSKYRTGQEYRQLEAVHRRSRFTPGQFVSAVDNDESGKLAGSLQRLNETNSCDCEQPQWVPADLPTNQWMCLVCSTVARLKLDG